MINWIRSIMNRLAWFSKALDQQKDQNVAQNNSATTNDDSTYTAGYIYRGDFTTAIKGQESKR